MVVGGGYTGLSTAIHLAKEGKRVVVLEAEEPGFGCSGRNGGQVNPGSTKMLPSEIMSTLGQHWGERFLTFGDRSTDLVFELIDEYNIDCEAVRPGYVQGAYGQRGKKINQGWVEQWQARDVEVEFLEQDQLHELIGSRGYDYGLLDPRGGNVQPLGYARGLARAAIKEGLSSVAIAGWSGLNGRRKAGVFEPPRLTSIAKTSFWQPMGIPITFGQAYASRSYLLRVL